MDETLQELENELKRLTPRQPPAGLMQALERELGPVAATEPAPRHRPATSLHSWKWTTWTLAGLAAAIAVAALVQLNRQPVKPAAPSVAATPPAATDPVSRYEPVRATSVLYDLQEGGLTSLSDRTEGREVRYRYVDTYTWKNPATNASLRWSVPRDEVRLVRANLD